MARVRVEPKRLELAYRTNAALRLDWQIDAPLEKLHGTPTAFVHLLERPGRVLQTFDHALPELWNPDRRQGYEIDLYQSALGRPLPPGTYLLTLGLYNNSWGYRWRLDTSGPDVGRREYQIATVRVPAGPPRAPRFELSDSWEKLSAGTDEQIPGRRWLTSRGKIIVKGIEGSGAARLLVFVPGPGEVQLSNDCDPGKRDRLPPGHRWLGVSLNGRTWKGSCEILFEPVLAGPPAERLLCLEVLGRHPLPGDFPADAFGPLVGLVRRTARRGRGALPRLRADQGRQHAVELEKRLELRPENRLADAEKVRELGVVSVEDEVGLPVDLLREERSASREEEHEKRENSPWYQRPPNEKKIPPRISSLTNQRPESFQPLSPLSLLPR